MTDRPIFEGRIRAGEVLYDVLGWPRAPGVRAVTLGGMEVACPVAYLGRGALGSVVGPPGSGPGATSGPALLVDDGCTPAPELLAAVDELLRGGVAGLALAAPWLPPEVRAGARARGLQVTVLLAGRSLPARLYPAREPPSPERVARFLEASAVLPARDLPVLASAR